LQDVQHLPLYPRLYSRFFYTYAREAGHPFAGLRGIPDPQSLIEMRMQMIVAKVLQLSR
jgi:hypothetical protein